MPGEDDPVKVKELLAWAARAVIAKRTQTDAPPEPPIDPTTRAQLEQWFGLPSYDKLAGEGKRGVDPIDADQAAANAYVDESQRKVREQRDKALAAVDPALLERHRARVERCDTMIKLVPHVDLKVDAGMAFLDLRMIEKVGMIADPREVEISEELRDDLRDCTPQALLRDLHRVETDFDKTFEMVDFAAEQRLDIVAEVDAAMKADLRLPRLGVSPGIEGRELLAELARLRRVSSAEIPMPNRRTKD